MNKGIVVFGGSFDPPHLGHLIIARWVNEELGLPVHFLPVGQAVHKSNVTSVAHRVNMLLLALANQDGFVLDLTEVEAKGPNYTVDTLGILAEKYQLEPEELHFLVGGDSVLALDTWYKPREIGSLATLLIISREGHDEISLLQSCHRAGITRARLVNAPRIDISSSLIKMRRDAAKPIDLLVPAAVEDYILKHKLYRC